MPSFAMCSNYKCEKRSKCLRYRAEPSHKQTYGMFDEKNCEMFWNLSGWNNTPMVPTNDADERNRG